MRSPIRRRKAPWQASTRGPTAATGRGGASIPVARGRPATSIARATPSSSSTASGAISRMAFTSTRREGALCFATTQRRGEQASPPAEHGCSGRELPALACVSRSRPPAHRCHPSERDPGLGESAEREPGAGFGRARLPLGVDHLRGGGRRPADRRLSLHTHRVAEARRETCQPDGRVRNSESSRPRPLRRNSKPQSRIRLYLRLEDGCSATTGHVRPNSLPTLGPTWVAACCSGSLIVLRRPCLSSQIAIQCITLQLRARL
jgi:hypothetical protein